MSNEFVKWRWDVLLRWYFPLLGECLLSVTFFSRDLPPCLLTRGTFLMVLAPLQSQFLPVAFSLRGARSSKGHAAVSLQAFDLALSEGRVPLNH